MKNSTVTIKKRSNYAAVPILKPNCRFAMIF
jgi:hypothetical protein